MPTERIKMIAEAYSKRHYDGNLMLLFNPYVKEDDKAIPYLDNKALDGFLNYFIENKCADNCEKCKYCKSIAGKAISIDQGAVGKHLEELKHFNNGLISSRFVPRKQIFETE